jgi:hypothetical protein
MPRKQSRQQRFTSAFPMWNITTVEGSNKVSCLCLECREETTFTAQTLNYIVKSGKTIECKSLTCDPPIPNGPWTHLHTDLENKRLLIECEECLREYWYHKLDASYFVCFCQLKTKQKEAAIYDELCDAGHTVLREVYFGKNRSSHKCDMMVVDGEREIFIEVDGPEHYSAVKRAADKTFHDLFLKNRKNTQFLVRIDDRLRPWVIESFALELENTVLHPVSELYGHCETKPGETPIFKEL